MISVQLSDSDTSGPDNSILLWHFSSSGFYARRVRHWDIRTTPLSLPPSPKSHFWMNSSLILSHSLHLTHTRTHTQFLSHSISHFESYYLLCLYLNLTRLEVLLSISVQFISLDLPLSNSLSKFLSLFLSNLHTHTHSLYVTFFLSHSLRQSLSLLFTVFAAKPWSA